MKKIFGIIIFSWLAIWAGTLHSQDFRVGGFNTAEGLPSDSIVCTLQDLLGFLWIGTTDGLCRFDGYNFKVFRHNGSDPSSLASNAITCLCEDREGNLWIGTAAGGLDKLDPFREKFAHVSLGPGVPTGVAGKAIRHLYIRPSQPDILWVGTSGQGLIRLEQRTGKAVPFNGTDTSGGLARSDVSVVFEDSAQNFWAGTFGGLFRFRPDSGSFEWLHHDPSNPKSLSDDRVLTIAESAAEPGVLWIGTADGLNRLDRERGAWERFSPETIGEGERRIQRIIEIPEYPGRFLLATNKGLFWFDTRQKSFVRSELLPPSLADRLEVNVTELVLDRGNVLWVGTFSNGILKLSRTGKTFVSHSNTAPPREGEPDLNNISSFSEMQDGRVLVTNQSGQGFWYNPADGKCTSLVFPASLDVLGKNGPFLTSHVSRDGTVWFGTEAGAWRWIVGIDQPEQLPAAGFAIPGLIGEAVYRIYEDPLGRMWFASRKGLRRYNPQSGILTAFPEGNDESFGLSGDYILAILVEPNGVIWIGTEGGLDMYDEDNNEVQHFINDPEDPLSINGVRILALHQDRADRIWVATDAGLNMVDFTEEEIAFRHVPVDVYIPNNRSVLAITEDGRGDLWLATVMGIARFSPADNIFSAYDLVDGVNLMDFLQGASLRTRRGEIYFGCRKGFLTFRPEEFTYNLHLPAVWPVSGTAGGVPLALSGGRLVLPHGRSGFDIEFAALDFQRPERNQYTYKLEGATEEWQMLGFGRRVSADRLAPGNFKLWVRGANNDGIWNPAVQEIEIQVLPPFWRTWPFGLIVAAAAVLLVLTTLRIRAKRRERRNRMIPEDLSSLLSPYGITKREIEVIQLVVRGRSNRDIEKVLFISMATVKMHLDNIYRKLGVKNRLELINFIMTHSAKPGATGKPER